MTDKEKFRRQIQKLNIRRAFDAYDDDRYYDALADLYEAGRMDSVVTASGFIMTYAENLKEKAPDIAAVVACTSVAVYCNETGTDFPAQEVIDAVNRGRERRKDG